MDERVQILESDQTDGGVTLLGEPLFGLFALQKIRIPCFVAQTDVGILDTVEVTLDNGFVGRLTTGTGLSTDPDRDRVQDIADSAVTGLTTDHRKDVTVPGIGQTVVHELGRAVDEELAISRHTTGSGLAVVVQVDAQV